MPAPINYMSYYPEIDLGKKFAQGFQIGNNFQNAPIEREQAQLQNELYKAQLQQQQTKQQKEQQYNQDLQGYWDNPTVEGAAKLATQHPEHAQAIKQSWDQLDAKGKENELKASVPIYSALLNGNKEVATSLLQKQIEAAKNAGKDTSGLEAYQQMIDKDLKGALAFGGTYLSTIQGADKFVDTFKGIKTIELAGQPKPKTYEQGKGALEGYTFDPNTGEYTKKIDVPPEAKKSNTPTTSAIQNFSYYNHLKEIGDEQGAADFAKSANLAAKDGKLSAIAEKSLTSANDEYNKAQNNIQSYSALGEELKTKPFKGGVFGGKWAEAVKDFTGNQDAVTDLRKGMCRLGLPVPLGYYRRGLPLIKMFKSLCLVSLPIMLLRNRSHHSFEEWLRLSRTFPIILSSKLITFQKTTMKRA